MPTKEELENTLKALSEERDAAVADRQAASADLARLDAATKTQALELQALRSTLRRGDVKLLDHGQVVGQTLRPARQRS